MASSGRESKRELLEVLDLTAGVDRRTSPTLLKPDRSRQNHNVRLSVPGRWSPRPGWETFSDFNLGAGRIQGGKRIYLSDTVPFTLAGFNGSVYKPSDTGSRGAAVVTSLDTAHAFDFVHDASMVAVFDGTHTPKKSTNGTTWTQLGITAPTVAPTVNATSGGSLLPSNVYQVSYTYEGSLDAFESNESTATNATTGTTTLSLRVTVTGTSDPQVANIDVYARDVTSGESVRRFAGTVANPGTTSTTTVTLTSNNWSDATEPPANHDVPPALEFGVVWKNRWWAKAGTGIRFSELFLPQSWPETYQFEVPFTRGDDITAIVPLGDILVIMGSSLQAFLVFAQTSLDFDIRPSQSKLQAGTFGFRAWDVIESGVLHAGAEGVAVFDGSADRLLSLDFQDDWRTMVAEATVADLSRIAVQSHDRDKEARIAVPDVPIYGAPGEWILDLARSQVRGVSAWSTTDRGLGGYISWDGPEQSAGNRGRLFAWSIDDTVLTEESVGTTADGADLTAQYQGSVLSTNFYQSRFTHCVGEFLPSDGLFSVTVNVDGLDVASKTINIGSGLAVIGSAIIGTDVIGGKSRDMFSIDLPESANGRGVSVTGVYQGQGAFEWYNYAIERVREPEIRGL